VSMDILAVITLAVETFSVGLAFGLALARS
jgi:hypothetical protein